MKPMSRILRSNYILFLFFFFLFSACTLPDVKPFRDATVQLNESIILGGDKAVQVFLADAVTFKENTYQPYTSEHPAHKLRQDWDLRKQAIEALVVYSQSLVSISETAERGRVNAKEVVGMVTELTEAVPHVKTLAGPTGELVTEAIIIGIEAKAHYDLSEAVQKTHPIVKMVAEQLKNDIPTLRKFYTVRMNNSISKTRKDFTPALIHYESVKNQRQKYLEDINSDGTNKNFDLLDPVKRKEIAEINAAYKEAKMEAEKKQSILAKKRKEKDATRSFYNKTEVAVGVWVKAHEELAAALEEKRMPNLVQLAIRAQELKLIIDQLD